MQKVDKKKKEKGKSFRKEQYTVLIKQITYEYYGYSVSAHETGKGLCS